MLLYVCEIRGRGFRCETVIKAVGSLVKATHSSNVTRTGLTNPHPDQNAPTTVLNDHLLMNREVVPLGGRYVKQIVFSASWTVELNKCYI